MNSKLNFLVSQFPDKAFIKHILIRVRLTISQKKYILRESRKERALLSFSIAGFTT